MTDLDTTTFNTPNGFLTTTFNTPPAEPLPQDIAVSVVIRSDNRIVMGGYSQYSTVSYITLSCYNTDGSLYTAFGVGGKVLLPAPSGFTGCIVNDVILQPNDYIIVTGDTSSLDTGVPRPSMFVARFTSLGVLDTSFGSGLGYVIIPPSTFNSGGDQFDQCDSYSVILQPANNYIVLGGRVRKLAVPNKNFIALVRLDTTGVLDTLFGTTGNGTVYAGFTTLNEDFCNCLSIQTDGKIVSGGVNSLILSPTSQNLSVVRFTTSGLLDTTFNTSGLSPGWLIINPNLPIYNYNFSSGIGINSVGQIIISSYITKSLSGEQCFGLAAVTSTGLFPGTLDISFGTGGQTVLDLSPTYNLTGPLFTSCANALALQSDNKIVITGGFTNTTNDKGFSLARFNTNGTLDLTFGLAGLGYILSDLISSITDNEIGYSVAIQTDGKVLVGGTAVNIEDSGSNRYFILARYFGFPPFPPPPIPTPIVPICFPAGTPVTTDQGEISIELIDPDIHTIFNKKIIAITETIMLDSNIVYFEKNSLGYNIPNKKTYISKYHCVKYNDKLIEAYKFVGRIRGVYYEKYNGELLYNVLMEKHNIIKINNLKVETLNPINFVAQLYTKKYTPEEKTKIILEMNEQTKKNANIINNTISLRNIQYTKRNYNKKIMPNYFITQLHNKTNKNYNIIKKVNNGTQFTKLHSNTVSHKPVIVKNIHHLSRSNKRLRR
jgi:uncharacterized delta-60 repeat protein